MPARIYLKLLEDKILEDLMDSRPLSAIEIVTDLNKDHLPFQVIACIDNLVEEKKIEKIYGCAYNPNGILYQLIKG